MTNLESVLRSRDITLLTKVGSSGFIVKALDFPWMDGWMDGMYGCESWTIKKASEVSHSVISNCL